MLNYVWISMLLIGIFVAAGRDVHDEIQNTYRNGIPFSTRVEITDTPPSLKTTYQGIVRVPADSFNSFYGISTQKLDVAQEISIIETESGKGRFVIPIGEETPAFWKEYAAALGTPEKIEGKMTQLNLANGSALVSILPNEVRFVKIRAVTKAAIEYADIAVTISLGLIGVMALWLGIMKVAEAAGLLMILTRLLTPVTKRLFPDVPQDHPAIGSMIMNIAANMLGLNNAATPLGLKAMEELNKINPKAGTATNAMCTFLVINTSGLTLIPATAIAIRAGLGSADPGIIIGTSIFGAGCATVAGLLSVKLLQRLPKFKKDLEVEND